MAKQKSGVPEWAARVLDLRKRCGFSQSEFGARLYYSAMAVSRWEAGKLEPSARCYIQLGNLAGDPGNWYFWEKAGLKRSDVKRSGNKPAVATRHLPYDSEFISAEGGAKQKVRKAAAESRLVVLRVLDIFAATIGQEGDSYRDLSDMASRKSIAVPVEWCPNRSKTHCLHVRGGSMNPLIGDGDIFAMDTSQTDPKLLNGKIVVASHRDSGLTLARMIVANGVQLLESENRAHLPIPVEKDRKWQIVGKVLWWIRKSP